MIYLSRHGLRLDKAIRGYKNDPNPPIHQSGIEPLIEAAKTIEHLDFVFCSPFLRCVQTAHYLNRFDAPIFIENGMSETLREKWYQKCGYNPLSRLHNRHELELHYYNVDPTYDSAVHQTFPETRKDSRRRNWDFIDWLAASDYWGFDILLVGHAFSVKDSLNKLGIVAPYQDWEGGFPDMGKVFTVDYSQVKLYKGTP